MPTSPPRSGALSSRSSSRGPPEKGGGPPGSPSGGPHGKRPTPPMSPWLRRPIATVSPLSVDLGGETAIGTLSRPIDGLSAAQHKRIPKRMLTSSPRFHSPRIGSERGSPAPFKLAERTPPHLSRGRPSPLTVRETAAPERCAGCREARCLDCKEAREARLATLVSPFQQLLVELPNKRQRVSCFPFNPSSSATSPSMVALGGGALGG